MRRLVFFFFVVLFIEDNYYSQKVNLEVALKYKQNYCGGARPSEEMEEEFKKTKAFANQKMILLKGKKADTLVTDSGGVIKLRLKKGTYVLLEPWRYYNMGMNSLELSVFDIKCLEKEWARASVQISVKRKKANVEYLNEIIQLCDWQLPCLIEGKQPPIPN